VRILFVSSSGALGGAERVLLDLATGLRARGHDIRVVSGGDGALVDRVRAVARVDILPFPGQFAALGESGRRRAATIAGLPRIAAPVARYLLALRRTVRPWAPEIVHNHGTKAHVLAAWAGLGGPLLWHLHEYAGTRPVSARLLGASAALAAGAIAVSGSVSTDFASVAPRLRRWTVPNAVDLDRFRPDGPRIDLDAAAGLGPCDPGTVRIGLVATYAWWKGHDVFLRALARLPRSLHVRGYIIGGPIYATGGGSQVDRASLEARRRSLGLDDCAGFTGLVDDVPAVMRSLDVVVHASTEPEPFGLAIAEGMACGRAVVVSAAGGAAEIVRPGEDTLAFPPGDAVGLAACLETLAADPAMRERIGSAARESARARFDRRRMVDDIEAVYRQVAASGPS
jgi:glycosyltransferase involved in cell wall biosynthesis